MTRIQQIVVIVYVLLLAGQIRARLHRCSTEIYVENVTIHDCLNEPIEFEMARCRGQCYSEDYLIYNWQSLAKPYRHQHRMYCCTPKQTYSRSVSFVCQNKQIRQIEYPFITHCDCKLCSDPCENF